MHPIGPNYVRPRGPDDPDPRAPSVAGQFGALAVLAAVLWAIANPIAAAVALSILVATAAAVALWRRRGRAIRARLRALVAG